MGRVDGADVTTGKCSGAVEAEVSGKSLCGHSREAFTG